MEIKQYLGLNEEQERMLDLEQDYVVEAGAGSGKTRVLVSRYLEILKSGSAGVDEIVAITFTVNAAREMKNRIKSFIKSYIGEYGEQNNLNTDSSRMLTDAPISTIHGFAAKIIRENPYECKLSGNFRILEGIEQKTYLEQSLNEFLGKAIEDANEGKNDCLSRILELEENNYNSVFTKLEQMLNLCSRYHLTPQSKTVFQGEEDVRILIEKLRYLISSGPQSSDNRYVDDRLKKLRESAPGVHNSESIKKISGCISNIKNILSNDKSPKGILSLANASAEEREFAHQCNIIANSLLNIFDSNFTNLYMALFGQFYEFYKNRKKTVGFMEYEDLLITLYELFESDKNVLEIYRRKYKYFLIDEFQDTDELQYKIINMLSSGSGPNAFIVGDFKQSIFGFRGANPKLLSSMGAYCNTRALTYNYRSDERLVSFYNKLFGDLISGSYVDMRSSKGMICNSPVKEIIFSPSKVKDRLEAEAKSVVFKIKELVSGGYKYGDIAIILKSNNTMHYFESALAENGIEYQTSESSGLFGRQEIRDIVALLKYILNPNDRISEACVLRSVFFGASDTELYHYFVGVKSEDINEFVNFMEHIRREIIYKKPFESLKLILEKTGYWSSLLALKEGVQKYRNVLTLLQIFSFMETRGNNLTEIVEYLDLSCEYGNEYVSRQDLEESESVKILSVHKAKGLEFPVVILADLNHGTGNDIHDVGYSKDKRIVVRIPGSKSQVWFDAQDEENKRKDEEEIRLLYVAMTRAEQKLILSVSRSSKRNKGSFYDLIDSKIPISGLDDKSSYINFMDKKIPVTAYSGNISFEPAELHGSSDILEYIGDFKDELSSNSLLIKILPVIKEEIPEFSSGSHSIVAGSLMHRFLQIWDFEEDTIPKYLNFVLNENCSISQSLVELVNGLAVNFLGSDLVELIRSADRIERELPFYLEIEGGRERRVIDLLIFKDRNISIYDYKYSKDIKPEYTEQLDLYEKALLIRYSGNNIGKYIVKIPEVIINKVS